MSALALPDLNALPADALRALILAQHEQLISREREIEHLKLLIAKMKRDRFGVSAERGRKLLDQLEMRLEELETAAAEAEAASDAAAIRRPCGRVPARGPFGGTTASPSAA